MLANGNWYAVCVRRSREFSVEEVLRYKGYDVFLPRYRASGQLSSRRPSRVQPMFPGYLFCSLNAGVHGAVLTTPGVISFVTMGGGPVAADPEEIRALQLAVSDHLAQPWPFVRTGQRIRVVRGPLRCLEGIVVRIKNQLRLVVSISLLQRSAAVEIDSEAVVPLFDGLQPVMDASPAQSEMLSH